MARARASRRTNLAAPTTSFVGRAADLEALGALLAEGTRLVTVTGPPGIGKTRLALEHARGVEAAGGVWFCDLSEATDVDGICGAVARALRLALTESPADRIGAALGGRGRVHVVLDNFEQVARFAAHTVGAWMLAAPEAVFVVTSRERLGLRGETLFDLRPLSLGGDSASEALRLFVERARSVRRGWALSKGDAPHVAAIVEELEGIPLAIELAAARMRILGPAQLRAELGRRFEVLAGGAAPARQATLRGAIDFSWNLLGEWERDALTQVSVFRGGFDLEAARAVLDLSAHPDAPSVMDALQALRDKSLVFERAAGEIEGELRFALLVSIREYAAEKLAQGGAAAVVARHRGHYLSRHARGGSAPRARVAADLENLLAVHERALAGPLTSDGAADAISAALALEPVLAERGPVSLLASLLDGALEAAARVGAPPELQARALRARADAKRLLGRTLDAVADCEAATMACPDPPRRLAGEIANTLGRCFLELERFAEARASLERALATFRAGGDASAAAQTLVNLGNVAYWEDRFADARAIFDRALRVARDSGDEGAEGRAIASLANLDQEEGRLRTGRARYERVVAIARRTGDRQLEGIAFSNAANLALEEGRIDEAEERVVQALAIFREMGHARGEGLGLLVLAGCRVDAGRLDEARDLYERAIAIQRTRGHRVLEGLVRAHLVRLESIAGRIADAESVLGVAETYVAGAKSPAFLATVSLAAGHMEWAKSRAGRARGADDDARAHHAAASARLAAVREAAVFDRSFDVRYLARSLERLLAADEDDGASLDAWVVCESGRWFRPPRGERVRLERRRALRLILRRLADRRLEAPGEALTLESLVETGWPGERIRPDAAATRAYGALSTLRRLGLEAVLLHRDDGYLLDPAVKLERAKER